MPRLERTVEESGFRVTVIARDSFRFAELPPYQELSGRSLKEMDVGWWDASKDRLVILELKGREVWDEFDRETGEAHRHLITTLATKANDVLLIMSAVWGGTGVGARLSGYLPRKAHAYPGDGKLKIVFLVDTPPERLALLGPVGDALNGALSGRLGLFGVKRASLVDYNRAKKMGLPVSRM